MFWIGLIVGICVVIVAEVVAVVIYAIKKRFIKIKEVQ